MLASTYFPHKRVSSALESLTSVFEMRTGVPLPTKHQHKKLEFLIVLFIFFINWIFLNLRIEMKWEILSKFLKMVGEHNLSDKQKIGL